MYSLFDSYNVYGCVFRFPTILYNPHVLMHRIEVEDGIVVRTVF